MTTSKLTTIPQVPGFHEHNELRLPWRLGSVRRPQLAALPHPEGHRARGAVHLVQRGTPVTRAFWLTWRLSSCPGLAAHFFDIFVAFCGET